MDLIADEPRFMPHLHLSLQHGDDMILKRMKRRHSRDDAIDPFAARCAISDPVLPLAPI
jgi:tRNA A37 methylthiotransferase MiaB